MQDDLHFRFRAGDEACVCHGDRERTSNEASKMRRRVGELVFLIASTVNRDENAEIMGAWCDTNAGTCELGTQLIKSTSRYSLDWAVDKESRDGGVV